MEDRWPGLLGSSVLCQDSRPPQRRCPQAYQPSHSSSPCPRQGSHCRSSCWDQSWRLVSPSQSPDQTRERPEIPKKSKQDPVIITTMEQQRSRTTSQRTVSREHILTQEQPNEAGHRWERWWLDWQRKARFFLHFKTCDGLLVKNKVKIKILAMMDLNHKVSGTMWCIELKRSSYAEKQYQDNFYCTNTK